MMRFIQSVVLLSLATAVNAADKIWTLDSHIFVFRDEKKTWNAAKQDCENMNMHLAKVDSHRITASIRSNVPYEVWIGAKQIENNNNAWEWLDGSKMIRHSNWWHDEGNGQVYTNWKAKEPSGPNEKCVLVQQRDPRKWNDYICTSDKVRFLCQKTLPTNNADNNRIPCAVRQNSVATSVIWTKNDQTEVPGAGSDNVQVYQTNTIRKSVLHVGNATLRDEGNYWCYELDNDGRKLTRKTIFLPALSFPTMVEALSVKCTSTVTVKFQPSRRASEDFHNITVFNHDRSRVVTSTVVQAQGEGVQSSTDFKLWPWTTYYVEVTACLSNTKCIRQYSKSTMAQTQGLPRSVRDVVSEESDKFSCVITWKYLNSRSKGHLTGYKIHWNETMEYVLSGSVIPPNSGSEEINNASATSYNFMGKPNRRYKFGLQAITCAGFGDILWSTEECVTDSKAPDTVTKPVVSSEIASDGTLNMTVNIPNQHNGKISCIFVIVKIRDEVEIVKSPSEFGIEDLKRANSSASEYIAISHQVKGNATQEDFVLGNGKASKCSIQTGTGRRTKRELRNNVFAGRNPRLYNNNTYNIFMVSASPARTGYALKASETVQVSAVDETSYNESGQSQAGISAGIVAGPILGVLVVLFIILLLVLWQRRKKQLKKVEEPQYEGIVDNAVGAGERDGPYAMIPDAVYHTAGEAQAVRKRTDTDILMKDFENVYNSMHSSRGIKFAEQFEELTRIAANLGLTKDFASNPQLKSKNRYKNILPYDATRVSIQHNEDGYINACFVDGHESKRKFIATQGPTKKTVNDFWTMVMEQECTEIVMLAKCVEGGKAKCEKYWPDLGDTTKFGDVKVSNLTETSFCGFVCRSLKVSANWKDCITDMMVSQFHFLRWPDHGFPITTSYILQMHRKCMDTRQRNGAKNPIVVHCSAGAGRTGAFIGYDILLNESKSIGNADVFECVAKMRRQRVEMVQTCDQYILVHKLLLETYLFGVTDVLGRDVCEKFASTQYKTVVVAEQFNNLSRVKPMEMSQKDSDEKITTYERMARKLYEDGQNILKSLGASHVETYDESIPLSVSKEPTKSNLDGFLKMIFKDDVSTVVMITEHKSEVFAYWNERCEFAIAVEHEQIIDTTTIRKLKITRKNHPPKPVTHIHLKLGPRGSENIAKINEAVRRTQNELRETKGAALVHCKNGIGMSGVYCAIMNLLERLKLEDHVDVFRAVKDLRDCKKGIIQTEDQYRLCHEAVLEYLRNFDTYSNFK